MRPRCVRQADSEADEQVVGEDELNSRAARAHALLHFQPGYLGTSVRSRDPPLMAHQFDTDQNAHDAQLALELAGATCYIDPEDSTGVLQIVD
jgi:hypothetical protein